MRRWLGVGTVAVVLVLSGGGVASAGEVNGNGEEIPAPERASSECAFSGLDTADPVEGNPPGFDDDAVAERGNQSPAGVARYHGVQSYGVYARADLKGAVPSPGQACRGS